jgi:hypothetical protein
MIFFLGRIALAAISAYALLFRNASSSCGVAAINSITFGSCALMIWMPKGDFHAWIACESSQAKTLRAQLISEQNANPAWIKASGYWRVGCAASHEQH